MSDREAADPVERVRSPFARASAPASSAVPPAPPVAPEVVASEAVASAALSVRATTGYEEDLVLRHRAAGPVWLCNEVLARCLAAPGEDPGEARRATIRALPIAARDRLLIELRRRSFGDRMEVHTACPQCGEKVEAALDLAQLDPGPSASAPSHVEEALSDGQVARVRLPTAGDQERLEGRGADNAAERRTALLALLIERIGATPGPLAPEAVHALPSRDRLALERRIEAETPLLDLSLGLTCPACARAWAAPIEVTSFFLTS